MSAAASIPEDSARAIARGVRDGSRSAEATARSYFDRIEALDDRVHAFLTLDREGALATAREIDRRREAGEVLGPLAGVPIAVKDNLCTKGLRTTCASKMLDAFVPPYDATVVRRLRDADAVLLGKTNLDEFAMGSSTENSAYNPTRNPWALDRVPGGSSGGSAAAVAAGFAPMSLGSDTGGSIRQPASLCGVVGLKPTYGRVSRYGLVAFASSLDQVGPITNDVADAELVFSILAGPDPNDDTTAHSTFDTTEGSPSNRSDLSGLRIGIPSEYFPDTLAAEVRGPVQAAIDRLRGAGADLREVTLPHTSAAIATYYVLANSEASSNLARFDAVRYGRRVDDPADSLAMMAKSRSAGLGPEVKRRIMLGTFALSAGYYDAYYGKALAVRDLLRADFANAFADVDALVAPTSPLVAFPLGSKVADPVSMYLCDILTASANLAGIPALSVPCRDAKPLPVGLQILGPHFGESTLFRIGAAHEELSPEPLPRSPVATTAVPGGGS